jgi:uncharacterized membrane protein YjgN (DUF898 family)
MSTNKYGPEAPHRPATTYGTGLPYEAPEVPSRYHADDVRPQDARGRVTRLALALVLAVLGVLAVVQLVATVVAVAAQSSQPAVDGAGSQALVGIVGSALVAALFLAYPVVVAVRLVRAHRPRA